MSKGQFKTETKNNMKFHNPLAKIVALSLIGTIGLMSSCKEEDRLTAADSQDISEEALTDSYFQDADDMGGVAVGAPSDNQYSGGRVATTITITDERFNGAIVTIEANGTIENPQGLIPVHLWMCAFLQA